jgi:hypothetical protein
MSSKASRPASGLDFLGDTGNYIISLLVVGMALRYRAMAAFAKGATTLMHFPIRGPAGIRIRELRE